MKATLTNVKKVLSALRIDAASHFIIYKVRKEDINLIKNSSTYNHDAEQIEAALQENFNCEFVRYKHGTLYGINVKSK